MPDVTNSKELFEAAQRVIPGGVNSPVRAFRGVGGTPIFVERAEGARVVDTEGRTTLVPNRFAALQNRTFVVKITRLLPY